MNQQEEIYQEMRGGDVGIWFISDEYGYKIAAKVPSHVIRSLINGCRMELLFGKDEKDSRVYFHVGARIYDDLAHPVLITQPCRFIRDYEGLKRVLNEKEVIIELYDELLTCSATAELTIKEGENIAILQFMEDGKNLYVGGGDTDILVSLDSFVYSLDPFKKTPNSYKIKTKSIPCEIKNWKTISKYFVGLTDVQQVNISDRNEGGTFERQIWSSMESLFLNDIYLNPVVKEESNDRELTDIFAHYKYGNFLVETKALGILNLNKEQTIERKVANVKKQILKGIKQLIGANNNIKKDLPVYSNSGKEIIIDSSLFNHCIVLVSELFSFGNWNEVEKEIIFAMYNEKMFLHIMDYHEFMKYLKASRGKKEMLDDYLRERVEEFVKSDGQIHMRTSFM